MRKRFIVGNWKMHGLSADLAEAAAIAAHAGAVPQIDICLCPPPTLLAVMANALPNFTVGGQDCHGSASGPYTGSVSAAMLADAGATVVIVGHSERRQGLGESDALVAAKLTTALSAGLNVIACVGEPLLTRQAGDAVGYVVDQVLASLPTDALAEPGRIAIAYEPIWAIGTGVTATAADIASMHGSIRGALRSRVGDGANIVRILYGGSVNADNAAEIFSAADVDGALVGGGSLTASKFIPIIEAAAHG